MTLDATLDYTIDSAKKKGERSVKKNLGPSVFREPGAGLS